MSPTVEPAFQARLATKSMPKSIARFYERFVVKASRPSIGSPSTAMNTHSLRIFLRFPQEHKVFFDYVFSREGDIFEGFLLD